MLSMLAVLAVLLLALKVRLISERGERGTGVKKAKQSGTPSEAANSGKRTAEQAYVRRASLACDTLLQGKWRVQILCAMRVGPVRLGQLVRLIPNVSRKMLVQNLRSLEGAGVVIRKDLSDVLLHVEYDLAPGLRESICLLLDELSKWGSCYSQNSFGEDHVWRDGFGIGENT